MQTNPFLTSHHPQVHVKESKQAGGQDRQASAPLCCFMPADPRNQRCHVQSRRQSLPTACAQSYTQTHIHTHADSYACAYAHPRPPTDKFLTHQSPGDLLQTPPHEKPPPCPSTSPPTIPSATAPYHQASSVLRPGASIPPKTECRAIPSSTFPISHQLLQLVKRSMA